MLPSKAATHRMGYSSIAAFLTKGSEPVLLDGAANLRENVAGIGADEADRPHDDHENHRQHNRVFCDILTALIAPEALNQCCHRLLISDQQ